jgi:hypothetical protein
VVRLEHQDERASVRAQATGSGRLLTVYLRSSRGIHDLNVNGRATSMSAGPGVPAVITYSAPPSGGITIDFRAGTEAELEAVAIEQRAGWPAGLVVPDKPASLMHWQDSACTYVAARAVLH